METTAEAARPASDGGGSAGEDSPDADRASRGADLVRLCGSREGSERVQAMIQEAASSAPGMQMICAQISGHVPSLVTKDGNWALQRLVEILPPARTGFVAQELTLHGRACRAARCSVGNRVIMRLFEWCPGEIWTQLLADQLADDASALFKNGHARHAMLALIRQGPESAARRAKGALLADVLEYAEHRNASLVVESLLHGGDEETACATWSAAKAQYGEGWRSLVRMGAQRPAFRVLAALALTTATPVSEEIWAAASAYPVSWSALKETAGLRVETAEKAMLRRVRP